MKSKIAIWAPLRYANYGDDLQAIALGKIIRSMGYSVKLFQLDTELSQAYDMESVDSLDELCKDVKLCIIAGGALLTPFNLPKRLLHRAATEYEKDFDDLLVISKKYSVKFCAISIGGDGKTRNPWMYYGSGRRSFFSSSRFLNGTVRLEGDVIQIKDCFGKDFLYYPDMLFRIVDYITPANLEPTRKYRVGLNFKKGKYLDKYMIDAICKYAEEFDDIEFHFTTTHMEKVGLDYQYLPNKNSKNIFIDRYESPEQLLGVLASMDIFITSMLHLGLTGLTTGTPFISYRGPGKTKSFLKSIGGNWAIVDDNISFNELKKQFFSKSREELYSQYNLQVIDKMKDDSKLHYEFCKSIVERYG